MCADFGAMRLLCLNGQSSLQPLSLTRANALPQGVRPDERTCSIFAACKQVEQILILFLSFSFFKKEKKISEV